MHKAIIKKGDVVRVRKQSSTCRLPYPNRQGVVIKSKDFVPDFDDDYEFEDCLTVVVRIDGTKEDDEVWYHESELEIVK